ncbi:hypothetical protein C8Q73DRAFT_220477 [Cubamyces lactineus]|nr:hypothetical protein C8Q73DRAFT_220477 [Cubamyces lactineus]
MPVRCHQCKTKLLGWGTGRQHAQLTGHVWQPGYYCSLCEATFSSHKECQKHHKTCQGASQSLAKVAATAKAKAKPPTLAEYRTSVSNIVTCLECREHFRDVETLALHRAEHQIQGQPTASSSKSTTRYPCSICKLEFTSDLTLLQHRKAVSPCDICAVCIPHEMMSLQDHFRQSNMHPKCRGCGLGFATLWDWTDHRHICTAPIVETTLPAPVESTTTPSLYAAANHMPSEDDIQDSSEQTRSVSSGEAGRSPARSQEIIVPDIPIAQIGSVVREIASTLSTAFSSLGSVSYVVHEPGSPTTLQNISALRDMSPRLEFDLELPASPAKSEAAFNPVLLDAGSLQSHRSEHHLHPLEAEELQEPELEADIDADVDVGSTAERSSLIAKVALDLIAQRFGAHAAERVARVMQALGAAPAEGEPGPEPDRQLEPEEIALDSGGMSTKKRAPMLVSVLDPDGGSECSTGRSSPSEAGIASPCSPSCAVSPPDVEVEPEDACSEAEQAEVKSKVASVYETPVPTRAPSPLALSIRSTLSTLTSAKTKAPSVIDVIEEPSVKVPFLDGIHTTQAVVQPVKTRASSLSWHCRSCQRDPCVDPVATVCGHVFCQSCLIRELGCHGACPVCKKTFLLKLDVGVSD